VPVLMSLATCQQLPPRAAWLGCCVTTRRHDDKSKKRCRGGFAFHRNRLRRERQRPRGVARGWSCSVLTPCHGHAAICLFEAHGHGTIVRCRPGVQSYSILTTRDGANDEKRLFP